MPQKAQPPMWIAPADFLLLRLFFGRAVPLPGAALCRRIQRHLDKMPVSGTADADCNGTAKRTQRRLPSCLWQRPRVWSEKGRKMQRQYPTKKCLRRIADAAERWAKTVRQNWPISDATDAENPARFTLLEAADTEKDVKRGVRQMVNVMSATKVLKELLADVEPADPLAGSPDGLQRCFSPAEPTKNAMCGWPDEASQAVEVLKEVPGKVHYAMHGPPWQPKMCPIANATVQGVEWAAGVLRDAVGEKQTSGTRKKAAAVKDQDDGEPSKPDEDLVQKLRGNGRELLLLLWGRGNIKRDELWRKIWAKRKSTGKGKRTSNEQKSKTIDRAVVYLNRRLEELGYHGCQVQHNGGLYRLRSPQK